MYHDISHNPKSKYIITEPGEHIFYFENISAEITFTIIAENADVKIYGLYQGRADDSFSLSITQEHTKPRSQSTTLIKSVLRDRSKLIFTGKIQVEKKAKKTIADLTNNNLLLGEDARVRSMPQLEVVPHEVTCSHASTTIPLDREQLHYIMTRGMQKKEAEDLLVNGFTQEVLQHKRAKRNPSS